MKIELPEFKVQITTQYPCEQGAHVEVRFLYGLEAFKYMAAHALAVLDKQIKEQNEKK